LDYAQSSFQVNTIIRQRVSDGVESVLATFSGPGGLANMASFTALPASNRWYFNFNGSSQFGFFTNGLASADATFVDPNFVVTNTNDSGPGSLRQAIINSNT